ncbi:hypothetical protein Cgig2_011870 [Carnegiea gigantea]|uniref:Uncharacterized protein n=1 Tax=Carnegiea gigantea TaxID=171969 RepID=A0A9Q1QE14_9CARY|nr:hypothetical protein Cgig2_011870 [Carnegiea gigantea]
MDMMIFPFDLVDITGLWNVALFSDDASKVLSIEPDKLYRMEYESSQISVVNLCLLIKDREKFYAEVLTRKSIYIKFTPRATFATSRILKWVMKEVQIFGCADGLHFGAEHDWCSLMFFGYFVNIDGDGVFYIVPLKLKLIQLPQGSILIHQSRGTKTYDITVHNVNWELTIAYKNSAQLYKEQAQKLKSILVPSTYLPNTISNSNLTFASIIIRNFMEFLEQIANELPIRLHSYENVTLDNHHYQSCLMVQCLAYVDEEHYILSDICKTPADTMQNATRKTFNYLQASYQFIIYDVNYEAMQRAWAECSRKRKKCELLHNKITTQDKGKAIVKYSG